MKLVDRLLSVVVFWSTFDPYLQLEINLCYFCRVTIVQQRLVYYYPIKGPELVLLYAMHVYTQKLSVAFMLSEVRLRI